ncbi:hypothetical protein ACJX0J_033167, partial [Zea mays]
GTDCDTKVQPIKQSKAPIAFQPICCAETEARMKQPETILYGIFEQIKAQETRDYYSSHQICESSKYTLFGFFSILDLTVIALWQIIDMYMHVYTQIIHGATDARDLIDPREGNMLTTGLNELHLLL